jgi:hypothetical protein
MSNGTLVSYNANVMRVVDDPLGTPSFTTIANDGMGKDFLSGRSNTTPIAHNTDLTLAVATSDGIFYVKNVESAGLPEAWVFRVDRDSTGTYISTPITTLPRGTVALNLMWHLGSLIITATDDHRAAFENNVSTSGHFRVPFYHYTNPNTGLLGLPLGDALDESPLFLLGANGPDVYFGGLKRIWIYDAVRGGIHPLLEEPGSETDSVFKGWALVEDSAGDTRNLFLHKDGHAISTKLVNQATDVKTVGTFGTDLVTHRLESNYIDFGLPLELKTLTNIDTYVEGTDVDIQYTVQIEVDDGSFVTRHTTNGGFESTDISDLDLQGYKFRYSISYETKDGTLALPFKEIKIQATSGEFVRVWDLYIDGTYSKNIENVPQDPEAVSDTLFALYSQPGHVAFVPSFGNYEQDDSTSYQVKVQSVRTAKGYPGESVLHVQLVGT